MNILERLIALIAPHECLQCSREGSLLCYSCQMQLPEQVATCYRCGRTDTGNKVCTACKRKSPLYSLSTTTPYNQAARSLIHAVKYARKQAGASTIAEAMALRLDPLSFKGCVVTHVPTASRRIRVRGYDQAELIAKELATRLDLPYHRLLIRMGAQRQVGQSRTVRVKQMTGAFRTANKAVFKNQPVLLIDDVITTGSTLEAAAQALRAAGAKRIHAAVFAKA